MRSLFGYKDFLRDNPKHLIVVDLDHHYLMRKSELPKDSKIIGYKHNDLYAVASELLTNNLEINLVENEMVVEKETNDIVAYVNNVGHTVAEIHDRFNHPGCKRMKQINKIFNLSLQNKDIDNFYKSYACRGYYDKE